MAEEQKKLFEVTMTAYKTFYVEAESADGALNNDFTDDEQDANWHGDFDWEFEDASAKEISKEEANIIGQLHPNSIVRLNEDGERVKE